MLSGQRPFEGETQIAVAMKRLTEDPPPLTSLRKDIPRPVSNIVQRALARDPVERFESAGEMRLALESALAGSQPATLQHSIDPTPTTVLPLEEAAGPPVTEAYNPQTVHPSPVPPEPMIETGVAPAAAVAERRRGEYRRLVVMGVAIAIAVGVGVFLLLALTGGTKIVNTPAFKGMKIEQARQVAADLGLSVKTVDRDSDQPAGTVTGQSIPAKTPIGSGTEILLGVSTGSPPPPEQKTVPSVFGLDREEAEDVLKQDGFRVKVEEVATSRFDKGQVFGQYPPANEAAQEGDEVTIFVAVEPRGRKGKGNND
jgi:serine/threonine-protein kinase